MMSGMNFVLLQYPSAKCVVDEPCHKKDIPYFLVLAKEGDEVFVLGHSSESVDDAWGNARINIDDV